jgi:hypothetical protein
MHLKVNADIPTVGYFNYLTHKQRNNRNSVKSEKFLSTKLNVLIVEPRCTKSTDYGPPDSACTYQPQHRILGKAGSAGRSAIKDWRPKILSAIGESRFSQQEFLL